MENEFKLASMSILQCQVFVKTILIVKGEYMARMVLTLNWYLFFIFQGGSPSDHEDENDPDGPFAFRRRRNCNYFAVSMLSILLEQAYGQLLGLNRMPKIQETQNLIFGFNFTAYSQSPWKLALV